MAATIRSWLLGCAVLTTATILAQEPAVAGAAGALAPTAAPPSYDHDVRPILADRCFRCHGPDAGARRAELRLDLRDTAVATREHGAAIEPGAAARSELWRRITTTDADNAMPPPDSGRRPLSADERELVRRWIDAGAAYEQHWSFVPPDRPPVPTVRDSDWCRTEVDAFVLAALQARSLQPSPAAAPRPLLRRLFLALTGLPPEPADLDAFAADPTPAAYDRFVDRLLDEEPYRTRFAERMATPWLDAARYADTSGIHMDAGRQMWAWRDWVLRAFRDNLPFDRFALEQLAGDLLPAATQDQQVASGFHRCHVTTDEGGAIDEEYLVEYAVDRTATTGSVFLGLTLGCARCHEHKFDPISHEDFYRLYAYFNSNEEPGLYSQVPDSNRALEPFLRVPSQEQQQRQRELEQQRDAARADLEHVPPNEAAAAAAWIAELQQQGGLQWQATALLAATSQGGAAMAIQSDDSVLCSGANPDQDHHELRLRTNAEDLRLLCLEALPDPSLPEGKVGRAENGNAVLTAVTVEAISLADPQQHRPVPLIWAWASLEQRNGDHRVVNALDASNGVGWAIDAHRQPPGPRTALFLADAPFGYPGGTEVRVTLQYDSIYPRHTFGRVRLRLGSIADATIDRLPEATSGWYRAGPFATTGNGDAYETTDGPEIATTLDLAQQFVATAKGRARGWQFETEFADGRVNALPDGINRSYVAQSIYAPSTRHRELSLGSDDGFRLYLDGQQVAERRIDRAAAANQDRAELVFAAGRHVLTMKVVNTGGQAGCYVARNARTPATGDELRGDLVAALLPASAQAALADRLCAAWRVQFSPGYREKQQHIAELEQQLTALEASVPVTMVMRDRAMPRPTYVLQRGEYDKPDHDRPVQRGVPAALGTLPAGAPDNRLGLAQWLTAAQNPLFARVQANRLFELLFGTGIVRTSEDFGMQGEWPSHRALLDWLAVEFRDHGYDVRHLLRLLVRSATFRQSNRVQPEAHAIDPDDRLLAYFPRRRLSAEQLRDQALFAAGLLVERFGGPSVKPYQPPGLWQEVAMTQSNTRTYERGTGDALYRRSLYTYYKRACPPPNMLTFDAPTREFCTIRRQATNTPLQALVLWNDEQFVEAARALAQRACDDGADDGARLAAMFVRCTGEPPTGPMLQRTLATLAELRVRFAAAPEDAAALLAVGMARARTDLPPADLAALTLVASAILNLDATICTP